MSWAARRRFIILFIAGAIGVAFFAVLLIATVYKAPTCSDTVQNQGEDGPDCGGPCAYLCVSTEQAPTVLFTKAITNAAGRTDVVSSIENKNNKAAAKDVAYTVFLYGPNQVLIQKVSGTLDLPPGTKETVYIPGVLTGRQTIANAFLEIDASAIKWFTLSVDPRIVPIVSNIKQGGTLEAPRIEATLGNKTITSLTNVHTVVIVRDARGQVIDASQTIVARIPAQGVATANFTWNNAFSELPAAIEVVPQIELP